MDRDNLIAASYLLSAETADGVAALKRTVNEAQDFVLASQRGRQERQAQEI